MGLGSVATFSLAEARQAALEARKLQAAGDIDPIERRKAQRAQERSREVKTVTFRQEADAYINAHRSSWKNAKHAEQWRATLETYVYPTIADVAVADVDTGMLVRILEPIWSKKTETANRVRGRIERILSRSASRGHRSGANPARWRGHWHVFRWVLASASTFYSNPPFARRGNWSAPRLLMIVRSSGQGVCSTASSSILSPTLETSLPAPAVVLQALSSGAARAIRVRVNNIDLLNMALPMIWVSGPSRKGSKRSLFPRSG